MLHSFFILSTVSQARPKCKTKKEYLTMKKLTCLGLSIVKHAAAYHDAKIQLDSQLGRGTRVRVLFPLSQKEAQP